MVDSAAHLVDQVLPIAPYRQWTFSVPWRLRPRLAKEGALLARVLSIFLRSVFAWQRRQARALGIKDPLPGAISHLQRFGSVLNLNVHVHSVLPDGVFAMEPGGRVRLVELAPPTDAEVLAICARAARRILALCDGNDAAESADDDGADFAHRDHRNRGMAITGIGHGDQSERSDAGRPGYLAEPSSLRRDGPCSTRRWALWRSRSQTASASVGSLR